MATEKKVKDKTKDKKKCEAQTQLCSGQMILTYGVNGSEKEKPPQLFRICGACRVYLGRTCKMKQVSP